MKMTINRIYSKFLIPGIAIGALTIANYINSSFQQPMLKISKQDSALNINDEIMKYLIMGQNRLVSSALWIFTLLESDIDHYTKKDLNSWLYLRFNSITNYDHKFLAAYQFGGQYLNIIKDDLLGSKAIFEKGLKVFPDNYELNFFAAFLYAFELDDKKRAITLYTKLIGNPKTPPYIPSIVARLKFSESLNYQETYNVLLEMFNKEADDTILKTRLHDDLYALKAHIDLHCLNHKLGSCNHFDFDGNRYIKTSNKFQAIKDFKPYKGLYKTKKEED